MPLWSSSICCSTFRKYYCIICASPTIFQDLSSFLQKSLDGSTKTLHQWRMLDWVGCMGSMNRNDQRISQLTASTAAKLVFFKALCTLTQRSVNCESECIWQCEGSVTVWRLVPQWEILCLPCVGSLRQGAAIMTGGDTFIFRCNCSFSYLPSKITFYCYVWKPSPLCKITVYQMGTVSWRWFSIEYFTALCLLGNIHFCSSLCWPTEVTGFHSLLMQSLGPLIKDAATQTFRFEEH